MTCVSDGDKCDESTKDALERTCNTTPCNPFSWSVGDWKECSETCGGGIQSRDVVCIDSSGTNVSIDKCISGNIPVKERSCNTMPCDLCLTSVCLGRGTCMDGACSCDDGYSGNQCSVPSSCQSGVVSSNLKCCKSGVVDKRGDCCKEGAQLDGASECCDSAVDACGVCGGNSKYIDMQGSCCEYVDANGICCQSGILDECGVCDGVGDTCSIVLEVKMDVPTSIVEGKAIQANRVLEYLQYLSKETGIAQDSISVGNIALGQGSRRRLHSRNMLQNFDSGR